jgi:hypothetical protein
MPSKTEFQDKLDSSWEEVLPPSACNDAGDETDNNHEDFIHLVRSWLARARCLWLMSR